MHPIVIVCLILAVLGLLTLFVLGFWGIWFYPVPRPKSGRHRVACVGDSCLYCMFVFNWFRNAWPHRLNVGPGVQVLNFGQNKACCSATSDVSYRSYRKYRLALASQADTVLLMLGANDTKPENWHGVEHYTEHLRQLVATFRQASPQGRVMLLTPLAVFKPSYGIREPELEEVREAIFRVGLEAGLEVLDLYSFTAEHPEWIWLDGVHPNRRGCRAIAGWVSINCSL